MSSDSLQFATAQCSKMQGEGNTISATPNFSRHIDLDKNLKQPEKRKIQKETWFLFTVHLLSESALILRNMLLHPIQYTCNKYVCN